MGPLHRLIIQGQHVWLDGAKASTISAIAWALSTIFELGEITAGANVTAAMFAARTTGFFAPWQQRLHQ
jgi:hypothetical protein